MFTLDHGLSKALVFPFIILKLSSEEGLHFRSKLWLNLENVKSKRSKPRKIFREHHLQDVSMKINNLCLDIDDSHNYRLQLSNTSCMQYIKQLSWGQMATLSFYTWCFTCRDKLFIFSLLYLSYWPGYCVFCLHQGMVAQWLHIHRDTRSLWLICYLSQ